MSRSEPGPGAAASSGAVDPPSFRKLMARWATGVSVVTAREANEDYGLTVNAFLSVSLAPPTVLISLTLDADTTPVLERTGQFAVSVLAADQRHVSERFAQVVPAREKFAGLPVERTERGLPLIPGSLAVFECEVTRQIPAGDHVLILGEVRALREGRSGPPLLFFGSHYARAQDSTTLTLG